MKKIKSYFEFPSKQPYAWLVYWVTSSSLFRISTLLSYYRRSNSEYDIQIIIGSLFVLASGIIAIFAIIQIIINTFRVIKKENKLTFKKFAITFLLLIVIYEIYNPIMNGIIHSLTGGTR